MDDSSSARPRGPRPVLLPNDEWLGGTFELPAFVTDRPEPYRPLVVAWMDAASRYLLASEPLPPGSPGSALADVIAEKMRDPGAEASKARPKRVRISDIAAESAVRALFGPGVEVRVAPVPELNEAAKGFKDYLRRHSTGGEKPGYLECGRVPETTVSAFFSAASGLWESVPWEHADDSQTVRLSVPSLGRPAACISIIGAAGKSCGLLIFDSGKDHLAFLDAARRAETAPRGTRIEGLPSGQLSVNFDPAERVPAHMKREIENHGWPVASPEAYPVLLHVDRDLVQRPLSSEAYKLATAACKGVSVLIEKRARIFHGRKRPRPVTYNLEISLPEGKLPFSITAPYEG